MLFAELEARIARLEEADKPFGSRQERIELFEQKPSLTDEGQVLFRLPDGRMGLGHTERGQFEEREVFASESDACVHVWNFYASEFTRGGGTPAYLVRALFPPRVADAALGREAAASTDPTRLAELAAHPDPGIRATVARRKDCPPALLTLLAADPTSQEDVAANPSTPADVLLGLAASRSARVRFQVASNPSTPPAALASLTSDAETSVVWRVAGSPLTPPEALAELATSTRFYLPRILAGNPSTPPEVLAGFENADDFAVRWALAKNPSTPTAILDRLVADPDFGVRWGVAANPSAIDVSSLVDDAEQPVRRVLALRAEPSLLAELAQDPDEDVRLEVAANPATPPEALAALSEGDDWGIALRLSRNPATPPSRLAELARHAEAWVRQVAAENPRTPL